MNAELISKAIVSGEKGPRIAGRTILGVILVVTLFLTAAIVYSRAATPHAVTNVSIVEAPLASNPEVMLARRYAAVQNQMPGLASLAANPELTLARRYVAGQVQIPVEASLAANPELSLAHRSVADVDQANRQVAPMADAARLSAIAGEKYNLFGSTA